MADERPPSPTLSVAATVPPPNTENITELMTIMKSTMDQLGETFDALGQTGTRVEDLQAEPALDSVSQIQALRRHLVYQDRRQVQRMEDIKDIVDYLEGVIIREVEGIIDQEVEGQVAERLKKHIPDHLQHMVTEHKRQLDDVTRNLNNVEARRRNAALRHNRGDGSIHPLYLPSAKPSDNFPKNLDELIDVEAEKLANMMLEYGLQPGESREKVGSSITFLRMVTGV
ncbi:uncharacterized protein EI90DRAFT_808806 [Cantharellus anzutake]|uniref:uncharacterized protein n=1 Tax=Cantharellus anzutake TaxID=1750568 RepID=UPI0019086CCE|nr:uncharacterized protein EI90DRAFT_808806 [Cantharellus anzutake]KAF8342944.1 hypothetical protein EI90DRAFT_808806 [Cantharellus anzutake]